MNGWEEHVADYLRLRRQLGALLAWDEHLLGQYTTHLASAGSLTITTANAVSWAEASFSGTGHRIARASRRLMAVRGFATYMHAVDPAHEIPPQGVFAHPVHRSAPYIYTNAETSALIESAGHLSHGIRAHTYPTLFGLLAVSGLRVGEALGLARDDVDLDTGILVVSSGKSRQQRLVPLHESSIAALGRYASWRDGYEQQSHAGSAPFFINREGDQLPYDNVLKAFRQAASAARIQTHRLHPRMHDLRHAFAVNTLLGWYRDGADVAAMMPALSTYLGHSDPANTYWYLSAVPELLAHASARLANADTHGQVGP
ncbi:tyrosine-type recombinase/integrase [Arthrobacter sp. H35-D1]|uniref:tyrosine-type recombinase/integrase n=1 Tax=Arthrobacter sp. H35-D1 TaxID=3046202 RepID=UPI0024BA6970|nr:tyrosine-type recombinase/integrase [Arthrobacter sp. H35-D1]MDJ0315237.1 tyrosine-type recombinase/integrase [Arthrobacter sp. H35-D1]